MDSFSVNSLQCEVTRNTLTCVNLTNKNKQYLRQETRRGKKKSRYWVAIRALKQLNWRETQKLLAAYRSSPNDFELRERIVEGNLFIVLRVVSAILRRRKTREEIDDLLTEGYCGLLNAIEKFDKLGSSSFGAYASFWIMQHVNRYLDMNESLVRLPIQTREKIRQGKLTGTESGSLIHSQNKQDANDSLGRSGHKREFYALTKANDWEMTLVERAGHCKSLKQDILDNFGSIDTGIESFCKDRIDIRSFVSKLPDREQLILCARNGFEENIATLDSLSERLGCTRERVRQLEKSGYEKVRNMLIAQNYEFANLFCDNSSVIYQTDDFLISPGRLVEFNDFFVPKINKGKVSCVEKRPENLTVEKKIFSKAVNYSFFTLGFVIPIAAEKIFYSNISKVNVPGGVHPIKIVFGEFMFSVKAVLPAIDNMVCSNINIRWGTKKTIIPILQKRHEVCFAKFAEDRDFVPGDCVFSLYTTNQKDVFVLEDNVGCNSKSIHPKINGKRSVEIGAESNCISEVRLIICQNFANGFVFNTGAIKLLENKLGRDCSETEQQELKRIMIKRSDDVYLLPEMVAENDTVADMTARIREYFAEYGCFSLIVLFDEFGYALKNLTNPDSDFRLFLLKTVLPDLPDNGKIFGRLQRQICIPGNISEEEVTQTLAERIKEILQGYGDAVCIDDLDNELPYLNKPALEMILQEHIADAIEIKVDGLSYWKLVEFFCLPDDFAEYLQLTVSSMEEAQTAPSLQTLSEAMEQQYGEGFREIYAVDDDDVFKQIIKVCIADDQYSWNRNVFAKQNAGQELNVADEFLQTQQGIFHESEFFDYASTHRGLTNTGMLILTFLRNKCIRLDQTHWISLKDFDNFSNFSTDTAEAIARELDLLRGSKAFLPLGTLTEAFLSNLPVFTINEQVFYWNHYLLASVAAHKISEVQVINDEPSPYTVTAMTIPQQVKIQGDVIDYIFQDLRKTHCIFSSANDVFEYLRTHQVRMVKTKKLFARIRDFWGVE